MGMLDRADRQRSGLPRVFLPDLVGSRYRRAAAYAHRIDRAESSVADRAGGFPGAVILIGTVLNPGLLFSRILETSPMRWIGKISYSLYIWQQLFLGTIRGPLPLGRLQEFPLNIVAVFVCAAASYYLLERPLVAIGHSLSSGFRLRKAGPSKSQSRLRRSSSEVQPTVPSA